MAKTNTDLSIVGHTVGDQDGFGPFRGAFFAFGVELLAAIAYGVLLHFGVWR